MQTQVNDTLLLLAKLALTLTCFPEATLVVAALRANEVRDRIMLAVAAAALAAMAFAAAWKLA